MILLPACIRCDQCITKSVTGGRPVIQSQVVRTGCITTSLVDGSSKSSGGTEAPHHASQFVPCMQHTRPLQDHPEFTVREHSGVREYRVENWRLARDGSGKVLKFYGWTWFDALAPLVVAVLWSKITTRVHWAILIVSVALYIYTKCTQLLWESVLAIPYLGIQLETHRGLPNIPLFVSRRFIPALFLRDLVINEGLRGWNVRYYVAAVKETSDAGIQLEVAFENILPYFPVLLHVYRDVHEVMFTQDDIDTDMPASQVAADAGQHSGEEDTRDNVALQSNTIR